MEHLRGKREEVREGEEGEERGRRGGESREKAGEKMGVGRREERV